MYRPRLRSTTGCLRCKQRHTKCDEALPRCSFCTRWDKECIRPVNHVRKRLRQPSTTRVPRTDQELAGHDTAGVGGTQLMLLRTPTRTTPGLDPFHQFPIAESQHNPVMAPILHQFFTGAEAAYSHDLKTRYSGLRLAFLQNIHADAAVFFAMIGFCAAFRVSLDTTQTMATLKLEAERSTLSLLRQRVEGDVMVTDATVLAAIMHINLLTYDTINGPNLRKMMNGVKSLVCALSQQGLELGDITVYMLHLCDVLCSLFNADEPCMQSIEVPARPPSFDLVYRPLMDARMANKHLTLDVIRLFRDLDFVLFFRTSSEKFYSLSPDESHYMFRLLMSIDARLTILQVQHVGDRSLNEIAVLGAILVKLETVAHTPHQLSTIIQILQRLRQAILMCPIEGTDTFESLAMWACFAALVGRGLETERKWFFDFILATLLRRKEDGDLSHSWMLDLYLEMRQFPWHERIDVHCTVACESFSQRHMDNSEDAMSTSISRLMSGTRLSN